MGGAGDEDGQRGRRTATSTAGGGRGPALRTAGEGGHRRVCAAGEMKESKMQGESFVRACEEDEVIGRL